MPHLSPLKWLNLYMQMIFLFLFIFIKMNFIMTFLPSKTKIIFKNNNYKMNWKI